MIFKSDGVSAIGVNMRRFYKGAKQDHNEIKAGVLGKARLNQQDEIAASFPPALT